MQDNPRMVTVSGQRFIDRVVDDLIDHVVQARAVVRIANVHTGAFANGIQSTEDFDAVCAVFVLLLFCHAILLQPISPKDGGGCDLALLSYPAIMD